MKVPDKDTHFRSLTHYQQQIREIAYCYVDKWNVAIDIGAHVGFFANPFSSKFKLVVAFEPEHENWKCLVQNCPGVAALQMAVGEKEGKCGMYNPAPLNSGAWEVVDHGEIPVVPLDLFGLKPDLLKIDVQGRTMEVLRGARNTLLSHPVVIVEAWKDGKEDPEPILFLEELGATVKGRVRKDVVMAW